jgi:hypothetical protein
MLWKFVISKSKYFTCHTTNANTYTVAPRYNGLRLSIIASVRYNRVKEYSRKYVSLDSSVGIATGYRLEDQGVGVWVGSRIFTSPRRPDRLCDQPSLLSNGYRELFPWKVKRPGLEADHSPPTSAEVTKTWIYTSTLPYASWRMLKRMLN